MPAFRASQIWVLGLVCVCTLCPASSARAASLSVSDLWVTYITQTPTSATGSIEFNLRFIDLNGDPGNYDFFSAQMVVSQMMAMGAPAAFTLNEPATEDTGSIGVEYWLPSPPTTVQNASTQGDEFRFSDFVPADQAITPTMGDVLAHYVIDFEVNSADGFGEYEILSGQQGSNFFNRDLVFAFNNVIESASFMLTPEPSTGFLMAGGLLACIIRRRRR